MELLEFVVTIGHSITLMYMLLDIDVKKKKAIYLMGILMTFYYSVVDLFGRVWVIRVL